MMNPLLYPAYRNLTEADLVYLKPCKPERPIDFKQDDILTTIFAPDPVTNIPRSDLAIVMSKDSSPVVSQYVRDNLMRSNPSSDNLRDDADAAIDMTRGRYETAIAYAERLRETIRSYEANAH